jgi:hypothetical protein
MLLVKHKTVGQSRYLVLSLDKKGAEREARRRGKKNVSKRSLKIVVEKRRRRRKHG